VRRQAEPRSDRRRWRHIGRQRDPVWACLTDLRLSAGRPVASSPKVGREEQGLLAASLNMLPEGEARLDHCHHPPQMGLMMIGTGVPAQPEQSRRVRQSCKISREKCRRTLSATMARRQSSVTPTALAYIYSRRAAGYSSSSISSTASTARPSLVIVSPPATSRSISPLTTVVVTVARVMPARSHSVRLATQNSRRRAGMLSAWACAALQLCHATGVARRMVGIFGADF
jgi:hypothetical protein